MIVSSNMKSMKLSNQDYFWERSCVFLVLKLIMILILLKTHSYLLRNLY